MVRKSLIAGCMLWLSPAMVAFALDWPAVPVPDDAEGEIVSEHMVYNGIDMRASRFTVKESVNDLKAFYREKWGEKMVETPIMGKTILGHASGKYYITVELKPSGSRTQGQIGITHLADDLPDRSELGKGFLKPPMTLVKEDIVYMDTPNKVRTLRISNKLSPIQNDQFFKRSMRSKGYRLSGSTSKSCKSASARCLSAFEKGDDRVVVAYVSHGKGTEMAVIIE